MPIKETVLQTWYQRVYFWYCRVHLWPKNDFLDERSLQVSWYSRLPHKQRKSKENVWRSCEHWNLEILGRTWRNAQEYNQNYPGFKDEHQGPARII